MGYQDDRDTLALINFMLISTTIENEIRHQKDDGNFLRNFKIIENSYESITAALHCC